MKNKLTKQELETIVGGMDCILVPAKPKVTDPLDGWTFGQPFPKPKKREATLMVQRPFCYEM